MSEIPVIKAPELTSDHPSNTQIDPPMADSVKAKINKFQHQLATQMRELRKPADEQPVGGKWGPFRHSNGVICCGSLRVARADFDNNTAPEVQKEILDALCASRPPADLLAVLDELEIMALTVHDDECSYTLELQDADCDCMAKGPNEDVRTLTAKLRSMLGGEV